MEEDTGSAPLPTNGPPPLLQRVPAWFRILAIVAVLYLFLASIGLMSSGFKSMGKCFADHLIRSTSNPFVGLFVGILATSIVQSSSLTTSIVVGMVASGTLTVPVAIPIVMGANIGTTVTNTIVSLGFIGRREEFRRAFSCGTVHDFFNYLCVLIFLPLELVTQRLFGTGLLEGLAGQAGHLFVDARRTSFAKPVKIAVKPVIGALKGLVESVAGKGMLAHWLQVALAVAILFLALWAVTRLMRSLMLSRLESVLDRTVGRNAGLGVAVGLILTGIVQSSSITTSILVPLAAAGIVTVAQVFPITAGANIGTTVTALMAALGGSPAGLHIALVHLLFNSAGTLLFVPARPMRNVPIRLANGLATLAARHRWWAVVYVGVLFFAIPALLVFLT